MKTLQLSNLFSRLKKVQAGQKVTRNVYDHLLSTATINKDFLITSDLHIFMCLQTCTRISLGWQFCS